MSQNQKLIALVAEIISQYKLFGITLESVPPTDKRVNCQIEIFDLNTGKTYAIQANTIEDITSLMPRLLEHLLIDRESK